MREQGWGSWGPADSSPAKGDTNNSHPRGGRRAPGTGVVVPASPGLEAPSRWPGAPGLAWARPRPPRGAGRACFLGPCTCGRQGGAPPSQAQPSPLMKACVCSSYGGILSSSVGLAVWGAGTGGGVSWGWGERVSK